MLVRDSWRPRHLTFRREDRGLLFLVMPYAELGDLFDALVNRDKPLSEPEARWLFRKLLAGTRFLHDKDVAFRDLSLENVLLFREDENGGVCPKITDPGQAIDLEREGHTIRKVRGSKRTDYRAASNRVATSEAVWKSLSPSRSIPKASV